MAKVTEKPALISREPDDEESTQPGWGSLGGRTAFILGGLGLLLASLVGLRSLTLALSGLGVAVVLFGLAAIWSQRHPMDQVWLTLGGGLSAGVLLVTLLAPGLLNPLWAIDFPVPESDPNHQVVVPRDLPRTTGRQLSAEEPANAVTEAIRQDDVLVRIESVKAGPLPDKGRHSYLLIHFRLASCGQVRTISFEGFSNDKHKPVLSDDSGRSYPFLEQRPRKLIGILAFGLPEAEQAVEVQPLRFVDHLLVFELPPDGFKVLSLELPASAWGRQGVCKLRIPGFFEARLPDGKTTTAKP